MYHRVVEVPEQLRSVTTVLLDARADDPAVPSVVPDEVQGGYTAVHELLRHGHRRTRPPTDAWRDTDRPSRKPASPSVPGWWWPIPADLSVIAFDNQELICDGMFPWLTTVGAASALAMLAIDAATEEKE